MAGDVLDPARVWTIAGRPLTGADLAAALAALETGGRDDFLAALGVASMSDRRADRAISILRGAGLVRYSRQGRRWEVAHGG
jgi:DNA-binding transcriptional ArsR family regulator